MHPLKLHETEACLQSFHTELHLQLYKYSGQTHERVHLICTVTASNKEE